MFGTPHMPMKQTVPVKPSLCSVSLIMYHVFERYNRVLTNTVRHNKPVAIFTAVGLT